MALRRAPRSLNYPVDLDLTPLLDPALQERLSRPYGVDLGPLLALGSRAPAAAPEMPALAPVARGSGMTNEAAVQTEDESRNKLGEKTATIMPREQFAEITDRVRGLPEFQDRLRGVENLEAVQAQLAQMPYGVDLAPLLALADSEYGSKLSAGYKRPDTPQERLGALAALEAKAQQAREQNADTLVSSIHPQITGETLTEQLQSLTSGQKSQSQATDPKRYEGQLSPGSVLADARARMFHRDELLAQHQKRMEPLQGLYTSFQEVDRLLGGAEKWDGKRDLPGIGATGRVPPLMLTQDGSELRNAINALMNDKAFSEGGKALTGTELNRLKAELGQAIGSGDREFVQAFKRFGDELKKSMKQKEAPIRKAQPEVLDLYREGGAPTSDQFVTPREREGKGGDSGGMTEAQRKRLDELRRKYKK